MNSQLVNNESPMSVIFAEVKVNGVPTKAIVSLEHALKVFLYNKAPGQSLAEWKTNTAARFTESNVHSKVMVVIIWTSTHRQLW